MTISKQTCIYFLYITWALWPNACYCQSSAIDTSHRIITSDWIKINYKLISFKYPPNWFYEKEVVGDLTRLSITPDAFKNIKNLRAVEIFDVDISKWTFEKFKRDFVESISNRGPIKATLVKKEIKRIKNHDAIYAEILQDGIATKVYGINSGMTVYMIFILSRPKGDIVEPNMDEETMEIFNSLQFKLADP